MAQVGLEEFLRSHPFAEGMHPDALGVILGCCANAVYRPGEYIFREGEPPILELAQIEKIAAEWGIS